MPSGRSQYHLWRTDRIMADGTPPPGTVPQSPPGLTSISPSTAVIGGPDTVLTANGTNFTTNSKIVVNGVQLPTTFHTSIWITAIFPPSFYSTAQTVNVSVVDGSMASSTKPLTLTAPPVQTAPTIVSIAPTSAIAGAANFTLVVTGTTVTSNSAIGYNGAALATTFTDATHVQATIPSLTDTIPGSRTVQVRDGSYVSNIVNFTLNAPSAEIPVSFFNKGAVTGAKAVDGTAQSLGLRVDPLVNGAIMGVKYYRPDAAANPNGWVALWHRDGTLLQAVEFYDHTGTGWKEVPFRLRSQMLATDAYVIGVWLRREGGYASTYYQAEANKFTSAPLTVAGKMTAPQNNGVTTRGYPQKNGLFISNSPDNVIMMPNDSFNGGNYFVDLDFVEGAYPAIPLGSYPNFRNTGHNGVLTPVTGDVTLSTPGQTYSNKDVAGKVTITANNVTVQNCRISNGAGHIGATGVIVIADGVTGTKIWDNTIFGQNTSDGIKGIWGAGDIRRNNIYGCEDGIYLKAYTGAVVQDNYIHDLAASGNPGPHHDGVSIDNAMTNTTIKHNTLRLPEAVSPVNVTNWGGNVVNTTIEDNICEGGTFGVLIDGSFTNSPGATITGTIIKDNLHYGAQYGENLIRSATTTLSGTTQIKAPPAGYYN
jgi:Domain of unknown function (DUF4082)